MIESKQTRFTIHSLNLDQLANQESPTKKGIRKQVKATLKRPISKNETFQKQIQIRSNLLNKERVVNSVHCKKDSNGRVVKMNKILLNLPDILHQPIKTDLDDEDEKKEDIVSYSSAKLNKLREKFSQSVKERYYKKIEVMKQIKTPTVSQQIFPISHISNQTLTSIAKQTNYAIQALKYISNKKSSTNIAVQKYQILRQKQDALIPKQLQTKKFTTRSDFHTISVQSKNSIRFKFDQMLAKEKRSCKKIPEKVNKIYIKGWQSDYQIGSQHNFMFD